MTFRPPVRDLAFTLRHVAGLDQLSAAFPEADDDTVQAVLEAAGAFAAEIEVVPVEVATAISERLKLLLWSMGAGAGCDAQYLFAEDVLGQNRGHMPRHSKVYRNFAAEYDRLQAERVAAFSEFVADVNSKGYPEEKHIVRMAPDELSKFITAIDGI